MAWRDYAETWLEGSLGRFLDYGCGQALFTRQLLGRCAECWAVDVDASAFPTGGIAGVRFRAIDPTQPLPFADEYFDTVAALEVIEHVADERATLRELARVLRPGGRLVLTTPHRGLLTWVDPGNFKFIAPRLHRFIHCRLLGRRAYYEERFGAGRRAQAGMLADFVLRENLWHRHYSYNQIAALAAPALEPVRWAAYFPAMRLLWVAVAGLRVLTRGKCSDLPQPLSRLRARLSRIASPWGDQLVVLFRKPVRMLRRAGPAAPSRGPRLLACTTPAPLRRTPAGGAGLAGPDAALSADRVTRGALPDRSRASDARPPFVDSARFRRGAHGGFDCVQVQ